MFFQYTFLYGFFISLCSLILVFELLRTLKFTKPKITVSILCPYHWSTKAIREHWFNSWPLRENQWLLWSLLTKCKKMIFQSLGFFLKLVMVQCLKTICKQTVSGCQIFGGHVYPDSVNRFAFGNRKKKKLRRRMRINGRSWVSAYLISC